MAVNVDNNFSVDDTNNKFVVSVNGVTGTVVIPPKDTYTLGTFMEALQSGINNLQGPSVGGLSPQTIDGVKVTIRQRKELFNFYNSNGFDRLVHQSNRRRPLGCGRLRCEIR